MKKKILILGGTGYLGSNIAINLSEGCDVTVTGKQPLNIFLEENLLKNNIQYKKLKLADLKNNLEFIENFHQIIFAIPNLQPHISRPFFHSDFFLEFLSNKEIDIVLESNPYPALCIVNSFYYQDKLNCELSPRLKRYILNNYSKYVDEFDSVQIKHFGRKLYLKSSLLERIRKLSK